MRRPNKNQPIKNNQLWDSPKRYSPVWDGSTKISQLKTINYGTAQHIKAQYETAQQKKNSQLKTSNYGTAQHIKAQYELAQQKNSQLKATNYGTAQHVTVLYETAQQKSAN